MADAATNQSGWSQAWRAHAGGGGRAALIVTAALVVLVAATPWAGATGALPLAVCGALQFVWFYLAFTPLHEAVHGAIAGRNRALRPLETAIGWLCTAPYLAAYPAFRWIHLRHHGVVNQGARDPDAWVAGSNALTTALRCLTIVPHYHAWIVASGLREPAKRRTAGAAEVGTVAILAIAVALGAAWSWTGVFALWIVPGLLAAGALALVLDWMPHHPHDDTGRFTNAVELRFPGASALMMGQHHHLVHHLWPSVPVHRLPRLWNEVEVDLRERGAHVTGRPGLARRSECGLDADQDATP